MQQRILRGVPATIRASFVDQDGSPFTVAGTVAVTVHAVSMLGADVIAAGTPATSDPGDPAGVTASLTEAQTASLDTLAVTWTAPDREIRTSVAIVGAYFFSLEELLEFEPRLRNETRFPRSKLLTFRAQAEGAAESVIGVSFVPRARTVTMPANGFGQVVLPDQFVTNLIGVGVDGVPFTTVEMAAVVVDGDPGIISRPTGVFGGGTLGVVQQLTVTYEFGAPVLPEDLKEATMLLCRSVAFRRRSAFPDKAGQGRETGVPAGEVGVARGYDYTGIDDVNRVFGRYRDIYRAPKIQ